MARRKTGKQGPAKPLLLPVALDHQAAGNLAETFRSLRGVDLSVDASAVQKLGAQCLAVLLSASRTWANDGRRLTLMNCSIRFSEELSMSGVKLDDLQIEARQP